MMSHATILELYIRLFTSPKSWAEEAEREATSAIAAFEELGDHAGLAKSWSLLGLVNVTMGRFAPARRAWEQAADHAEQAGERRDQLEALGWVLLCMWAGPAPVEECLERCHIALEQAGTDHKARATAMFMRGLLEAGTGNVDEGRSLLGHARSLLQEVAMTVWMAGPLTQMAGLLELAAGDPVAAERQLRWGNDTLEQIGEMGWRPTLLALLAQAVYEQGRYEDAEELATASREMAGGDDVWSQVLWRSVGARVRARQGTIDEAERLARESLELATATDSLQLQGEAFLGLAEVLHQGGRVVEAGKATEDALALFQRKGEAQAARRASTHLQRLNA